MGLKTIKRIYSSFLWCLNHCNLWHVFQLKLTVGRKWYLSLFLNAKAGWKKSGKKKKRTSSCPPTALTSLYCPSKRAQAYAQASFCSVIMRRNMHTHASSLKTHVLGQSLAWKARSRANNRCTVQVYSYTTTITIP